MPRRRFLSWRLTSRSSESRASSFTLLYGALTPGRRRCSAVLGRILPQCGVEKLDDSMLILEWGNAVEVDVSRTADDPEHLRHRCRLEEASGLAEGGVAISFAGDEEKA